MPEFKLKELFTDIAKVAFGLLDECFLHLRQLRRFWGHAACKHRIEEKFTELQTELQNPHLLRKLGHSLNHYGQLYQGANELKHHAANMETWLLPNLGDSTASGSLEMGMLLALHLQLHDTYEVYTSRVEKFISDAHYLDTGDRTRLKVVFDRTRDKLIEAAALLQVVSTDLNRQRFLGSVADTKLAAMEIRDIAADGIDSIARGLQTLEPLRRVPQMRPGVEERQWMIDLKRLWGV